MKLVEAQPLLEAACGRRFGELFRGHPDDLRTNKGNVGQLLLLYIGLKLDGAITDFDDGELKTNKAQPDGNPRETMFIRQISGLVDTLVRPVPLPFGESTMYQKIRNILFVPVVKDAIDASEWYFVKCVHVQVQPGSRLYAKLEEDYITICGGLRQHIETSADKFIHTTNGPHYMQVRSKDVTPYHPIYSATYGRKVSNKNHAFYFMKSFMQDALRGQLEQ